MRAGLTLSVMITSVLIATIDARAQTHVGIKAGAVNSNLSVSGSGAFDTDGEFGFVFGGFVGIPLGPRVRLQPEFLVTERRFTIQEVSPTPSVSSIAYEMPVFLQVRFGESTQPFLQFGPQVTIISNVKQRVAGTEIDIGDEIGDVDFGLAIGAGVEAPLNRGALVFEGRAQWGFRDLIAGPDTTMRSRALMLLAGYRF
jgi:opacity protein-like surface antigen